jgi:hypothetical protein
MSQAFEVTAQDVANVLHSNEIDKEMRNGRTLDELAETFFDELNFFEIEKAALFGNSLDEQTDYANDEIARQLRDQGILKPLPAVSADPPAPEAPRL